MLTCCSVSTVAKQFRANDHCEIARSSLSQSWHRLMPLMSSGSNESIKIQDYYLIREIKTWLNINHVTVPNNTYFLKVKEQLFKNTKVREYWFSACFGTNLTAQIFAFSLAGTSAVMEINADIDSDCILQVLLPVLFVSAMSRALLLLCVHQNLAYLVLLLSVTCQKVIDLKFLAKLNCWNVHAVHHFTVVIIVM